MQLLKFGLSADKTQATIEPTATKPTVAASEVEQAMFELATLRAAMLPSVADEPAPTNLQRTVPGARVAVAPELADAGILLVRDIGRGWLGYRLERSQLQELHASIGSLLLRPQMTRQ
jgi:hypothetical protein